MSAIDNPTLESAMAILMEGTDLIDGRLGRELATLLGGVADLHEPRVGHRGSVAPPGCQWCDDEDWPCADTRKALAVAEIILGLSNGSQP